jgi:hypothetical protein
MASRVPLIKHALQQALRSSSDLQYVATARASPVSSIVMAMPQSLSTQRLMPTYPGRFLSTRRPHHHPQYAQLSDQLRFPLTKSPFKLPSTTRSYRWSHQKVSSSDTTSKPKSSRPKPESSNDQQSTLDKYAPVVGIAFWLAILSACFVLIDPNDKATGEVLKIRTNGRFQLTPLKRGEWAYVWGRKSELEKADHKCIQPLLPYTWDKDIYQGWWILWCQSLT